MNVRDFFEMNDFYDGNGVTMIVKDTEDNVLFKGIYLDMIDEMGDKEVIHFTQEVNDWDYDGYITFNGIVTVK